MAVKIRMGLPEMAAFWNDLSPRKYGFKIFQSYLENNTPSAGRIFWAYGLDKQDIIVLAIEPHPEDQKRGAYQRIKLSVLPAAEPPSAEKPGSQR
jgi:hypothetical protein